MSGWDLAPLMAAIDAAGMTSAQLAERAALWIGDVRAVLAGDDEISDGTLWRLAEAVRVDPDRAEAAGWPDWLVSWLRCARISEEGFEWIRLDDGLAPGHYLVETADREQWCIVVWSDFQSGRPWRPGQGDPYRWSTLCGRSHGCRR